MAGRAARRLHCPPCVRIRATAACILRTCVRAAFLFNIPTLYYICKSMKWQDFGKIKKDKFAAAAESGRQPCGLPMDYVRWMRAGELWRGVREDWAPELRCAPGEMAWELGFAAGRNVYLHSKLFFYGSWRVFSYRRWKTTSLYIKGHLTRWKTVVTVSLKFQ